MNSFPEDFSAKAFSDKLKQNVASNTETKNAREYIYNQATKYINENKSYFPLDMKNFSPSVRQFVLTELQERFPNIGYRFANKDQMFNSLMSGIFYRQSARLEYPQAIVKVKNTNDYYNHDTFLVAVTEEAGKTLENFIW